MKKEKTGQTLALGIAYDLEGQNTLLYKVDKRNFILLKDLDKIK
jgi:hypothetical protein